MASYSNQIDTQTEVDLGRNKSIEALQVILANEQLEPVSYEEAEALGYELTTFFAVFEAPGKKEESNGSSPDVA